MGLMDFGAKILLNVRADTSQAKQEIKSLAGEEKKLAQDRLAQTDKYNAGVESQIGKLGKLTLAAGAAGVAIHAAFELAEFSGRKADLANQAASFSMDKLRDSSLGLKSDMELLEIAAKANQGQFKLNQQQMEVVAKAMVALEERGNDAAEVFDTVTNALVKGRTAGLEKYGISIKETSSEAAKFSDVMHNLTIVSEEVSEASLDNSDKLAQSKVAFKNVFDEVKDGLGQVVASMAPYIQALSSVLGLIGKISEKAGGWATLAAGGATPFTEAGQWAYGKIDGRRDSNRSFSDLVDQHRGVDRSMAATAARLSGPKASEALADGFKLWLNDLAGMGQGAAGTALDAAGAVGARGKGKGKGDKWDAGPGVPTDLQDLKIKNMQGSVGSGADDLRKFAAEFEEAAQKQAALNAQAKVLQEQVERSMAETADRQSFTYKLFGSYEEIDATTHSLIAQTAAVDGLRGAYDVLSGAVTAGYSAMVDGNEDWKESFKRALADGLKSMGAEMAVNALKQTALGIGALASYNYDAAGKHFASAGYFTAGAIAAGYAANRLGTSASSSGAGGAAAAGARDNTASGRGSGNGGKSGSGEREVIIVYGDAHADSSPRAQRQHAEKIVKRALGASGPVERN